MSAQFTPGPWEILKHTCAPNAKLDARDDWSIRASGGLSICFEGQENPNADADARLIAAAPELYEALVAIEPLVTRWGTDKWRDQMNAALAKARGEQ